MGTVASLALLALLPIVGGLLFALIQLGWYRLRVGIGRMRAEDIPFFGLLLFRGLILTVVLACVVALTLQFTGRGDAFRDYLDETGQGIPGPQEAP